MFKYRLAALAAALALTPILAADDKPETIENSTYVGWAKEKKGTSVVVKTTTESKVNKSSALMTSTLLELDADRAIVETRITTDVMGMKFDSPPTKLEIKKMIELPKGKKKGELGKPEGLTSEGEETLKIGKTDYKTKWYKYKQTIGEIVVDGQMWISEDVPGQLVKSVTKVEGMFPSTTTMELVEVKKP